MATLEYLVAEGKLERYVVDLEFGEQPERYIYANPVIASWFEGPLRAAKRDRGRNLLPLEQVDEALYEFVRGDPMVYGTDCRKLEPHTEAIWELKTTDVRIFGWFPRKSTFLMVGGALRADLSKFAAFKPYIDSVIRFRSALCLDDPKALKGDLLDVI
jgi:hypothetical protein